MGIPLNHPAIRRALERGLIRSAMTLAELPPNPTEKQFQAAVDELAESHGWHCYHTHDSRRSAAGFPDLVLVRGPVLLVAELKVKKNRTTPAQEKWLTLFEGAAGVRVRRWRETDWPAIVAELTEGGVA